jgi:ABC-type phosphate transport system substrate-binding protein
MNARLTGALVLGAGALGLLVAPGVALAQDAGTVPSCNDTTMFPNPIYLAGSSAFEPVIQAMANQLNSRTAGAGKVTLIYQTGGNSCGGAAAVRDQSNLTGSAHYYTTASGASGQMTCTLDTAPPKADVGISDVFYETCGFGARPSTVADYSGPAQAMLFVVPTAATGAPASITAEEAANVWGCGMRGMVSPWTVETAIQQRSATSGTQNVIARSINVLASSFHGTMNATGGALVTTLTGMNPAVTIADPNSAIGFLAADAFDTQRSKMKALAFRGLEQTQAYYADSAADQFDKRNVRNGHYLPWGYEHLIVKLDATTGKPSPAAQNLVDWVLNNTTTADNAPNFDPILLQATAHVIPLCAMSVQRKTDGGFLSPYTPADPCGCAFEATATQSTPAGCMTCTDDNGCSGGKTCHHGYCE